MNLLTLGDWFNLSSLSPPRKSAPPSSQGTLEVWPFLRKLNIRLPYNPAIALLNIYPNELKTYLHIKTCTPMFIATLFIIAKAWKQPKCPSVGEWINKLWYIQAMEYYSALKRNEPLSHEKTEKKLQSILLSEKGNWKSYLTIWRSGKGKTLETR